MKERFPEDVDYAISLDQTLPVTEGMRDVVETLVIAILLVIFVVYLFLQDWRATLIPMLAVPVSLVGTFALFPLFGFSINTLSLFGLVLAIGLVVDDAIVVVRRRAAPYRREGLAPKDAALKAMKEFSATSCGDCIRCWLPVDLPSLRRFIPGITGRLYQQFRHDHRHFRDALRVQCAHAQPAGARGSVAAAKTRGRNLQAPGPLGKFFDVFNLAIGNAVQMSVLSAGRTR